MKKALSVLLAVLLMSSLTLLAAAENFTPSAESAPGPELKKITDSQGNAYDALIEDASGNLKKGIDPEADKKTGEGHYIEVIITSLSEKDQAKADGIKDNLTGAAQSVKEAENIGKLSSEMQEELTALMREKEITGVKIEDLVVCRIFDTTLLKDSIEILHLEDGEKIRFTISSDFAKDDIFFILHNRDGNHWEPVSTYTIAENGDITITVDSLSAFAFVVDGSKYLPGPPSPQTGVENSSWLLAGIAIFAGLAVGFYFAGGKKREH